MIGQLPAPMEKAQLYDQIRAALPLLTAMLIMAGILFYAGLYTVFLYIFQRDVLFLYYILYTSLSGLLVLMQVNVHFDMGLPLPVIKEPRVDFFFGLVPFFFALHIARLIELPTRHPTLWTIIKVLLMLLFVQIVLAIGETMSGQFIMQSGYYYQYENTVSVLLLLVILQAIFRSKTPLRHYLLVGAVSELLVYCRPLILPAPLTNLPARLALFINYPPFLNTLSTCLAAIAIALAFAYRIYLVELKKKQLQRGYTQQLEQEIVTRTAHIEAQSRSIEAKNRQQLKTEFEQKLAETKMASLRSQMNPHFIFNCLNSIQYFTAQNNAELASAYLAKFARLIRLVLENSRSERVTLTNELETLRLYIDMEAMRFQQKVRYTIQVDEAIDTDLIQIPPLLLQPFVENAIWHGLMHKEEGGSVRVTVSQPGTSYLQVEITDDGVGRAKAAEYKSKSATKNKSFGMQMTADRIELINQLYHTHTQVQVMDQVDERGQPAGTRVVVNIPV